jgi:outer membrane protein TolC
VAELTRSIGISLAAQLADAWTALLAQRQLLDLLDQQQETATRFLDLIELRFRLGQATAADVARQRQQLLTIAGQRELALARRDSLQANVATLLGSDVNSLQLPDARELPPVSPLTATVPGNALVERPDLKAAYLQLQAADARLASATAGRLPVLGIGANINSVERSAGDLFGDKFWQVGLKASQALFDFGQRRANVDIAGSQAEQAYYEYAASLVRAVNEVSATLAQAEAQDRYLETLDDQLQEASRILILVRDGYRLGQQNFLDVLAAQQALQALQQSMVEEKRMQLSNRIQLCRTLGEAAGEPSLRGQEA